MMDSALSTSSRAAMYDALAAVLGEPGLLAGLPQQSLLAAALIQGAQALGSAACRQALLALQELPAASGPELRRRFEQIAARPGARPLALHESLALGGHLAGRASHALARRYARWGLEADEDLPDAASVELAFLAFLCEGEDGAAQADRPIEARRWRREQRSFLRQHALAWLPQLGRSLADGTDPHFRAVGSLLEDFLSEEQRRLFSPKPRALRPETPAVQDAALCSLCGFCVQSCPTAALWIAENPAETSLALNLARCIGCGQCLPVCPDHALVLTPRPAAPAGAPLVLRRSPRAHCPGCGQATVSQAELESVFQRLEAAPGLRRRISLCASCKSRIRPVEIE